MRALSAESSGFQPQALESRLVSWKVVIPLIPRLRKQRQAELSPKQVTSKQTKSQSTCNPNTQGVEVSRSEGQSYPQLFELREFKTTRNYIGLPQKGNEISEEEAELKCPEGVTE